MDAKQLARLVLETLDAQQRYFKTKDPQALRAAQQYERALRKAAQDVSLPIPEKTLFPDN
jgi:hypothetical protein